MSTNSRRINPLLVAALVLTMAASQAHAWNPPDGPADRPDLAETPATPTTLLPKAHGYIIQNGISILYNDGYWFAAQMLRQSQQELLNGVRYADKYLGDQVAAIRLCLVAGRLCIDIGGVGIDLLRKGIDLTYKWPLAADNHYFNPDTGQGLTPGFWGDVLFLFGEIPQYIEDYLLLSPASVVIDARPDLKEVYTSALQMFDEEYAHALNAYFERSAPSCGRSGDDHLVLCWDIRGRQGPALAMFYLGWASHLMQDMTVVHHTYDTWWKGHTQYECFANGFTPDTDCYRKNFVPSPPVADGRQLGIYEADLAQLARDNQVPCQVGSRTCFALYAAYASHDPFVLDRAAEGDYSNVEKAIPFAQRLQAGLYAAFLTDIGLRPVHMSAVIAAL